MKHRTLFASLFAAVALSQLPRALPQNVQRSFPSLQGSKSQDASDKPGEVRLPNGKLQRDEMLKADYTKNVADAAQLARLAAEVNDEIEKNDQYAVSVKTLKKLDEISKLARGIHGRLNRY